MPLKMSEWWLQAHLLGKGPTYSEKCGCSGVPGAALAGWWSMVLVCRVKAVWDPLTRNKQTSRVLEEDRQGLQEKS